jgi:hypothetical protein
MVNVAVRSNYVHLPFTGCKNTPSTPALPVNSMPSDSSAALIAAKPLVTAAPEISVPVSSRSIV